jgi:hypothetical protein
MDAEAKIRAEDTRIMLADLVTMDADSRALFLKNRAKFRARDPYSATPISTTMISLWTTFG